MALMVPHAPPLWRPGWFAEKNLYEALRSGLPGEYHDYRESAYPGSLKPLRAQSSFSSPTIQPPATARE